MNPRKAVVCHCLSLLLPSRGAEQRYRVWQHSQWRGRLRAAADCTGGCKTLLSPSGKQAVKCAASLPPADLKARQPFSQRRSAGLLLLFLLFRPVNIPGSVN